MQDSPSKQPRVLFPKPPPPHLLSRNGVVYRIVNERIESCTQTDAGIINDSPPTEYSSKSKPKKQSKSTQTDNDFCNFFTNLSNEFQKLSDEFQKLINPASKSDQQRNSKSSATSPIESPSTTPKPLSGENFCDNIEKIFNDLKKETDNFFKGANDVFNPTSSRKKSPSNVSQNSYTSLRF
jgi:hypothetical protein